MSNRSLFALVVCFVIATALSVSWYLEGSRDAHLILPEVNAAAPVGTSHGEAAAAFQLRNTQSPLDVRRARHFSHVAPEVAGSSGSVGAESNLEQPCQRGRDYPSPAGGASPIETM